MGRIKEFFTCEGCDTFLLDDRLDVEVERYETDECFGYVCPICGTRNEKKKIHN